MYFCLPRRQVKGEMKERGPIFYDAERVRWRRTRRVMEISGVLLTLLLAYFFVTIAVSVELPAELLPDAKPAYRALKSKKKTVPAREGRHRRVANIGSVPASYDPLRAAFFVSWDANSLASLKKHYKDIDLLIPEQLHAVTADGALTVVDYEHGQNRVKASPAEAILLLKDDKLHQWMKSLNPPVELPMMGLVNNYDGVDWRIKEMAQLLATPAARRNLARDIVEYAVESHEAGIVVDFEEVPDASQAHFRAFIGELAPAMHAVGLKLMIALPARDDAYDYEFFGKQCDAIVLMNYDQHWPFSPPGPIAAQDWFVENLRQVLEVVPAQKIVVGIANYAYDWSETAKKQYETAAEFSIQEALLHVDESETDVEFDSASMNPHYSYYDEHNHVHQVWMLDAITAYNELRGSERLGVQGTALNSKPFAAAQFVVRRDGVQHPHLMHMVVLVVIGIVRIHRSAIKLDVRLRFIDVQQRFLNAEFGGRFILLLGSFGPIVSIIRDSDDDLLRGNNLKDLAQIFNEPVLRGDGARRRKKT